MSDNSIEYSLNTPVFSNLNILNQKIIDLVKNNNLEGGNGFDNFDTSNYLSMLIGIIIIIVGFVLLWFKNDLVELEATILNKSCNSDDNNGCKINITYTVDSTQYSKIVTMNKNNIPNDSTIKIYYQKSDPNSIQLVNPNYSLIGIGSIIVGLFVIIFSMFNSNLSNTTSQTTILNTKTNLYNNSTNVNGYDVVYTK
jgi:hypothetical protein